MRDFNVKKIIESYNCLLREFKKLDEKIGHLSFNHNDLEGLQGGNRSNKEFFHLTREQRDEVARLRNNLQSINTQIESLKNKDNQTDTSISNLESLISSINSSINSINSTLLNKVDKVSGKQLSTQDFTTEHKNKLDGINTNLFLQKGTYTGTAQNLKDDIDGKLSASKRITGITVTGDVNKEITISFLDGTSFKANFTDNNTIPGPDVRLNSLNWNVSSGVLTGVRSDGQQLTVNLDGRYANLTHTHTLSQITGSNNLVSKPSVDLGNHNINTEYVMVNDTWTPLTITINNDEIGLWS